MKVSAARAAERLKPQTEDLGDIKCLCRHAVDDHLRRLARGPELNYNKLEGFVDLFALTRGLACMHMNTCLIRLGRCIQDGGHRSPDCYAARVKARVKVEG